MALWNKITQPGYAWLVLCCSLVIHQMDEAANDFLAFYNPQSTRLEQAVPLLDLPQFSFGEWILSLAAADLILLVLTPLVFNRTFWIRYLALFISVAMILNALGHLLGSLWLGLLLPGIYSSPLLLTASVSLFIAVGWRWKETLVQVS